LWVLALPKLVDWTAAEFDGGSQSLPLQTRYLQLLQVKIVEDGSSACAIMRTGISSVEFSYRAKLPGKILFVVVSICT